MRILTKEYLEKLKRSEAYQMIVNTPPPDLTKARKDAEIFARWIAREHRKERLAIAPGCEYFIPHRGKTGKCAEDGFLPRPQGAGRQ